MADWNPALYLKFENERTRPTRDLVARVQVQNPRRLLDIGCGPGNSTAVLKERWSDASVTGLDKSPAMVEKAKQSRADIEWVQADAGEDLARFGQFDVILANASLQWLPDHRQLLPRIFESVSPGGALAVQIPQFDRMPMAQALADASRRPEYAAYFTNFDTAICRLEDAAYYDVLCGASREIDLWVTHYYHVLENHAAIVEWIQSTAMRPYLERIPAERQPGFVEQVLERVKQFYPVQTDGRVLFLFKRLFFIAYKA